MRQGYSTGITALTEISAIYRGGQAAGAPFLAVQEAWPTWANLADVAEFPASPQQSWEGKPRNVGLPSPPTCRNVDLTGSPPRRFLRGFLHCSLRAVRTHQTIRTHHGISTRLGNGMPHGVATHMPAHLLDAVKTLRDPEDKSLTDGVVGQGMSTLLPMWERLKKVLNLKTTGITLFWQVSRPGATRSCTPSCHLCQGSVLTLVPSAK